MKAAREWRAEALACYQHDDPIPYDQFIERVQRDAAKAALEAAATVAAGLTPSPTLKAALGDTIRAINIDALMEGGK